MDTQKDIDKSNKPNEVEAIADTGLLSESPHFHYVLKKTEKLTSASYMLTSFIPSEDPLKNSIREKSLTLLSTLVHLRESSTPEKYGDAISKIIELCALFEIAYYATYVSRMNYLVLRDHYTELSDYLRKSELIDREEKQIPFAPLFFKADQPISSKGHFEIKDMTFKKSYKLGYIEPQRTIDRKETILKFVQEKGKVGIKDIRIHVKGYSEKTLQRDLLRLVSEGRLKKQGERRWSIYSLV